MTLSQKIKEILKDDYECGKFKITSITTIVVLRKQFKNEKIVIIDYLALVIKNKTIEIKERSIDEIIERIITEEEKYYNEKIKDLNKYDIRNITINEKNLLKSPSFSKDELSLMNLGISLYLNFDKIFKDDLEETEV